MMLLRSQSFTPRMLMTLLSGFTCAMLVAGCTRPAADATSRTSGVAASSGPAAPAASGDPQPATAPAGPAAPTAPSVSSRPRIVVLGDSLTAGYGLSDVRDAFPAQLQKRLDTSGYHYEVVNMGVSGDTSAGGLRRLDWSLDGDVKILILALGGNDGLRGLAPEELAHNLEAMIDAARRRGVEVLLCGMEAPPNFGESYTQAFRGVFTRVAREKHVALLPFLLDGVAGSPSLNQPDGIHPTAEGARRVADLVWARLEPMLREQPSR